MIFEEMFCAGNGKGGDIYLSGDGDKDTEYLRLSIVHVWGQVWLDMRPAHLKELTAMLDAAVDRLDGNVLDEDLDQIAADDIAKADAIFAKYGDFGRKPNFSDIARKPRPQ